MVAFKVGPPEYEGEQLRALKNEIRRAMALWEDGETVAAFNLLKRAIG